jgi:hypothetical protein
MESEGSKEDIHNGSDSEQQQESPSQAGRPTPIVLTTETNLIVTETIKRTSNRKL